MYKIAFSLLLIASSLNAISQQDMTPVVRLQDVPDTFMRKPSQQYFSPDDHKVYKIKPAVDIPLTVAGVGWTLFGFSKIYGRDTSTTAQVMALNKNDIASINRSGASRYSVKAFDASNMFFYGSMPFPLVLMLDKHIRKDAPKIGLMYLQALAITGSLYSAAAYIHPKYRPYAYNPNVDIERRKRGGARNSFYAGHVAMVGTATFFTAKVFADYHPESKIKWVMYSIAGIATGTTAYLRYRAGEHFPTDVFIGTAMGTLSGILVPHFHKNKNPKEEGLGLGPSDNGMSLVYRF
jgi:membrane-associated phospholipid phosphatase